MKLFVSFVLGAFISAGALVLTLQNSPEVQEVVIGKKFYNLGGCKCGCVKTGMCTCKNCNEPDLKGKSCCGK
jgi:hypothetical protein